MTSPDDPFARRAFLTAQFCSPSKKPASPECVPSVSQKERKKAALDGFMKKKSPVNQ
jgi:hypothetical protein